MPMPNLLTKNKLPCLEIKCNDFQTEDGPPAWCYLAGMPAETAAKKCPKLANQRLALGTEKIEEHLK
jgi:hypothetical protein